MAHYSLHELKELQQTVVNRSKSLPKEIRELSSSMEPLQPLVTLVERYRASEQDIPVSDDLKIGLIVSLTKEYLKRVVKKPTEAWLNYQVACLVYDHEIANHGDHVAAMNEAKRPHKHIKHAKEDKNHWLRKTPLKKVMA